MKVVIAIDSFKGSLSSLEAAEAVQQGILEAAAELDVFDIDCEYLAIADGGEGTIAALAKTLSGKRITIPVQDPLGRKIAAQYLQCQDNVAIIEMAQASGLTLLAENERNPLKTSTFGTGELLLAAIEAGFSNIFIGIGGSATNEAGMGLLRALGIRFLNGKGEELFGQGEDLPRIETIDLSRMHPKLKNNEIKLSIICDVNNPLYGPNGAAHVFGPQKCNSFVDSVEIKLIIETLDRGLMHYAQKVSEVLGISESAIASLPGAGAAGGLGAALANFLGAELIPGIDAVLKLVDGEAKIRDADWVVTGEGQLDAQSVFGKVPMGVAAIAQKYNIPVIGLSGAIEGDPVQLHRHGISSYFSMISQPISLEKAMDKPTAAKMLKQTARELFRLILIAKR